MRRARSRAAASFKQRAGTLLLALGLAASGLAFGAQQTLPLVLAAACAVGAALFLPLAGTARSTPRSVLLFAALAAYRRPRRSPVAPRSTGLE
jgi:hypothetical protein